MGEGRGRFSAREPLRSSQTHFARFGYSLNCGLSVVYLGKTCIQAIPWLRPKNFRFKLINDRSPP